MQVIDKAIIPDGIEIELRDLSGEHKLPDYNGMEIVFHTIAKNCFIARYELYIVVAQLYIHYI